jgi:hypothetical protein
MKDEEDTDPLEQWKNEDEDGGYLTKLPGTRKGSTLRNVAVVVLYLFLGLAILGAAVGEPPEGGGNDILSADADEHLSEEEAAEYVTAWVSRNVAEKDRTAFNRYEKGVEAIEQGKYSRAVYELENSERRYEDLKDRLFEKRNQYDEDQNRYELFQLAWRMYFLRHEGTSARYLQAFNAPDNPMEAARWKERADEHYTEASRVATEYHNTIDEWQGE